MPNKLKLIIPLSMLVLFFVFATETLAASRYWVGSGASTNWNATGNTNWSLTSGGANNETVPGSADDVFFDANSGVGDSVISAAITIKSLNATGYTGTITHNNINLTVAGSVTLVSGMTYTPLIASQIILSVAGTFTTGGKLMPSMILSAGTTTLGDNLSFMASKITTLTLNGNFLVLN